MFFGMVFVYSSFGVAVASIPPMVDVVRTDLGMSRGAMGIALSCWTLMYIFTAPIGGRVVDRIGIGWSISLGGVSLAASFLARSAAQGTLSLGLAVAIMGLGGPLISAAAPTLCAQWFSDPGEQRRAVALYSIGPSLGGTIAIFATNSLLLPWLGSWRAVLRFEAGFAALALVVWLGVWRRAPRLPTASSDPVPMLRSWANLVRSPSVRHVLTLGALSFFVMHSLGSWLVDALSTQASISAAASGWWVAAGGFVGMGLITMVAGIAGRFGQPRAMIGIWVCVMAGLVLVALAPPLGAQIGVLLAAARSMLVPLMIMMLMASPDVNMTNMGVANGLFFSFAQVGATIGPFATGRVADSQGGGFTLAMLMLASAGFVTILIVARTARQSTGASSLAEWQPTRS